MKMAIFFTFLWHYYNYNAKNVENVFKNLVFFRMLNLCEQKISRLKILTI